MPKRKGSAKSGTQDYEFEQNNFDEYDEVVVLPNADDSGSSDSEDEEPGNLRRNSESHAPTVSYNAVFQNYTESQKKLEPHHIYDWKEGEIMYTEKLDDEFILSRQFKKQIQTSSPVEIFELFFSAELKQYIVDATHENGFVLSLSDLELFVSILLLTTYNIRTDQRDYWSQDEDLRCESVVKSMSRNKFMAIKSNIKYSKQIDRNDTDRAWRVRQICNIFRKNISQFGFFSTALAVDEMMVKFYGRTCLKQFIKSKPVRFGIKLWAICSASGFMFDFDIYCGKNGNEEKKLSACALGSKVVLQMVKSLLLEVPKKQLAPYHLYFDNFFTSPDLVVHLRKNGLRSTGVVRKDRIKEKHTFDKKAARGKSKVMYDETSSMNYISVIDSKQVSFLSTAAGVNPLTPMKRYSHTEKQRVDQPFPRVTTVYNQYMGV